MRTFDEDATDLIGLDATLGAGRFGALAEDVSRVRINLAPVHPGDETARRLIDGATVERNGDVLYLRIPEDHAAGDTGGIRVGRSNRVVVRNRGITTIVSGDGDIVVSGGGSVVTASTSGAIAVTVVMPNELSASVEAGSADVTLHGVYDRVELRTGSGDQRVEVARRVELVTGSGDVLVDDAMGGTVRTGSGDIVMRRTAGRGRFDVRTDTGDVRLLAATGRYNVETGTGDIEFRARGEGGAHLRTGRGDVDIRGGDVDRFPVTAQSGCGEVRRHA